MTRRSATLPRRPLRRVLQQLNTTVTKLYLAATGSLEARETPSPEKPGQGPQDRSSTGRHSWTLALPAATSWSTALILLACAPAFGHAVAVAATATAALLAARPRIRRQSRPTPGTTPR